MPRRLFLSAAGCREDESFFVITGLTEKGELLAYASCVVSC